MIMSLDEPFQQQDIEMETLVGRLFTPAKVSPSPAVLVLGGSEGAFGWSNAMGTALAMHGITSMAISYFDWEGKFGLPDSMVEIPLDPFAQAIEILQSEQGSEHNRLVVIGYSRGAELALLLGTHYPEISGVVGYMPSSLIWRGFPIAQPKPKSSWTYQGQPVPFAYFADGYFDEAGWQDEDAIAQALIPVEKVNGPLLLISGAEDSVWPSTKMAVMIMSRLRSNVPQHSSRHIRLDGVGHDLGVPDFSTSSFDEQSEPHPPMMAFQAVLAYLNKTTE